MSKYFIAYKFHTLHILCFIIKFTIYFIINFSYKFYIHIRIFLLLMKEKKNLKNKCSSLVPQIMR